MTKTALAALLITSLCSTAALAQSKGPTGFVGGSVGYVMSDVAKDFGDAYYTRVNSSDDSSTGYKLYGGMLWGNWGFEVGYYDFGNYKTDGSIFGVSTGDKFTTRTFGVSAVGSWPVGKNVSLIGKLGLAPATTKYECVTGCAGIQNEDTNSVGVLFSFGVGWHVSPNVMLRADWDALGGVKAAGYSAPGVRHEATYNYNMLSVGVEARF